MKVFAIVIVALIVVIVALYLIYNNRTPQNLGVTNGKFAPCPATPNCVSSQSDSPEKKIPPIEFQGEENPIEILSKIALEYPKARIVKQDNTYLHVEFRSKIFSFVDDAEFYWDKDHGRVEIRSAARLGYSDLGVNKARALEIKKKFQRAADATKP